MIQVPESLVSRYKAAFDKKSVSHIESSWEQALLYEADFQEIRREFYETVGWWNAFKFEFKFCFARPSGYCAVFVLGMLTQHIIFGCWP